MKAPKTFENGLARLQAVLTQMQDPDTALADSIKLYAEAADLIRYCNDTLENAKLRIDEIDAALDGETGNE